MGSLERQIRALRESDLEMLLSWRNHPEVRRYMLTQHKISADEHMKWFRRTSVDPQRHLLIYQYKEIPLGFISLYQTPESALADWGFYLSPDSEKGTGNALGEAGLTYAFEYLKLHKICGKVLSYNACSIRFHESLGFVREGILRQQHLVDTSYHDLVCFGLLSSDWKSSYKELHSC
jgi:UDP-4-amino-4,6-dideoxy-N-acetyl-beta-L-altrosamine N-acetyltransferase